MMNFTKALELTARTGSRKLENNTYLVQKDETTIAVRLHRTDVVLIHSDGTFTLNSDGWQTAVTKDRINNYSPARVHQKAGVWYVGEFLFVDNMRVDFDGNPINGTPIPPKKTKARTPRAKAAVPGLQFA